MCRNINVNVSLSTENKESDFIKFNGTYGDSIKGSLNAEFVHTNVNLEGKDTSKLQSSFGSLKKEEVNVKKLLKDSKGRLVPIALYTVLSVLKSLCQTK